MTDTIKQAISALDEEIEAAAAEADGHDQRANTERDPQRAKTWQQAAALARSYQEGLEAARAYLVSAST